MPNDSPNRNLLDEINAAQRWFHARKTRPIWARRLDAPQRVRTLEGDEEAPAGSFLCRGEAGDVWPQAAGRLEKKYSPTDDVSPDGWRKYLPQAEAGGVWAARIDQPFEVQAAWGKLNGKAGDYLLKDGADGNVPYPDDVWIVDAKLFAATYDSANG